MIRLPQNAQGALATIHPGADAGAGEGLEFAPVDPDAGAGEEGVEVDTDPFLSPMMGGRGFPMIF